MEQEVIYLTFNYYFITYPVLNFLYFKNWRPYHVAFLRPFGVMFSHEFVYFIENH